MALALPPKNVPPATSAAKVAAAKTILRMILSLELKRDPTQLGFLATIGKPRAQSLFPRRCRALWKSFHAHDDCMMNEIRRSCGSRAVDASNLQPLHRKTGRLLPK
jgi:hypothetical protein